MNNMKNPTKHAALKGVVSLAALLATAGWASGAGTASAGGSAGHAGGGAAAAPAGGGGGETHAAAPAASGGEAHSAAPSPAAQHSTGNPNVPNAAPGSPSTPNQLPALGSAVQTNTNANPNANFEANQQGNVRGNDNRAQWRQRNDNGGYNYPNPNFYPAYSGGYINAGADGYYNNYYGYSDQGNNGPIVTEPGTGNSAPAQQPVPAAPAAVNNAPSPVGARAAQANSADNNPQVLAADGAVREAQEAYDVQRKRVLEALQQQPDYQAALARRGAAQEKLNAARAGDAATDPAHLVPAASAKLDAGDEVTRLQQQAIDNDPAAKAAEVRLHEASMRRDQLRAAAMGSYRP